MRLGVIALGNSRTGKTHVCLALGLAACQRGFPVSLFTAAGPPHSIVEAHDGCRSRNRRNHHSFLKAASAPATNPRPSPPRRTGHSTPSRKVAWFCYAPLADFYFGVDTERRNSRRSTLRKLSTCRTAGPCR